MKNILLGIAVGDAFGAGVEFQDRNWIKEHVDFSRLLNVRHQIQVSDNQLKAFTKNYKAWDYTDDTEMTIGLMKALMSTETFSTELLISKWKGEYDKGIEEKGYGRNGHGSMSWYYSGEKTIEEIRAFQKNRNNPGNAPAMRAVPLGLIKEELINEYAAINANATHPNINAIISSQCIARATEYLIVKKGNPVDIIKYCQSTVKLNKEYEIYLNEVDHLVEYEKLKEQDFSILCGSQPIQTPYFLAGINGVPSDSKYTTGAVLYILKNSADAFEALRNSINLGGDVDSIASITTGIMAGMKGLESIPDFMLQKVEGRNYIEALSNRFSKIAIKAFY